MAIVCGKQQIGPWAVDKVSHPRAVLREFRIDIAQDGSKSADVVRHRSVEPKRSVNLELAIEPELELRLSPGGIEGTNLGGGIERVAVQQHTSSKRAAQSADGQAAIELARKAEHGSDGDVPVGHTGPAIHVPVVVPVLAAVIAGGAELNGLSEDSPGPGHTGGEGGLAGLFSGLSKAVEESEGRFSGEIVEDAALDGDVLIFGQAETMLHANLGNPAPQIAGVAEGRNCEGCE